VFDFFKKRRRAALREEPFSAAWRAILEANVPYLRLLSAEEQTELEDHIKVFLAEKSFEGCGGLQLTEEITVTIAAQACLLLLHRETDYYPELESILVYPSTYVVPAEQREGGVVAEGASARLGESWQRGMVVLAWDAVLRGASDIRDGRNVVLHEFAHQLDQEDGSADGAPELPRRSMYPAWAHVLGSEFDELIEKVGRHRRAVIDEYGATNPAEFFAVVTETFFEKPRQLKAKHPELYDQLVLFYRQDPAVRAK
jgi:Mlc titration factor MtfA (ptsG expression regulator)